MANNQYLDVAAKIFPLELALFEHPGPGAAGRGKRVTYSHLASCASGSLAASQALREALQIALYHLRPVGSHPPSFESLCRLVGLFFRNVGRSTCEVLAETGILEFVIAGFDPATQRTRVFRFQLLTASYPLEAKYWELADSDLPLFLGSGGSAARKILASNPQADSFSILKAVILDDAVPSVGGGLQYTRVGPDGYVPFGVSDYSLDAATKRFRRHYYMAGIEVSSRELYEVGPPLMLTYVCPFETYLESRRSQGYQEDED